MSESRRVRNSMSDENSRDGDRRATTPVHKAYEYDLLKQSHQNLKKKLVIREKSNESLEWKNTQLQTTVCQLEKDRCCQCDYLRRQMLNCTIEYEQRKQLTTTSLKDLSTTLDSLKHSMNEYDRLNKQHNMKDYGSVYNSLYGRYDNWKNALHEKMSSVMDKLREVESEVSRPLDVESLVNKLLERDQIALEEAYGEKEWLEAELNQTQQDLASYKDRSLAEETQWKAERNRMEETIFSLEGKLHQQKVKYEYDLGEMSSKCEALQEENQERQEMHFDLQKTAGELFEAYRKASHKLWQIKLVVFENESDVETQDYTWSDTQFLILETKMSELRHKDNLNEVNLATQRQTLTEKIETVEQQLMKQIKEAESQKIVALTRCAKLEDELGKMSSKRDHSLRETHVMCKKVNDVEGKLKCLSEEAIEFRTCISKLEESNRVLKSDLLAKQQAIAVLEQRTYDVKEELTRELQAKEGDIQEKLQTEQRLKQRLQEAVEKYDQLKSDKDAISDRRTSGSAADGDAKQKIAALQVKHDLLKGAMSTCELHLQSSQQRHTEHLEAENQHLKYADKKHQEDLQKALSDFKQLQQKTDQLSSAVKELEGDRKKILKEKTIEITELKTRLSETKKALDHAKQELQQRQTDHVCTVSSQSEILQMKEDEITRLRGELETRLKNETSQDHALKRLAVDLDDKNSTIILLSEEKLKQSGELQLKRDECNRLKTNIEQVEQRAERLLSTNDEVQMLKNENDEERNRFKGLQEQHSQLKTDLKSTQRKLEVAEKSCDDLQKQLRRLEQNTEIEIQRNKELSEQISHTKKEIKNSNKKFESLERQHQELQSDKDRFEQELKDQIERHQKFSSELAVVQVDLDSKDSTIHQLNQERDQLRGELQLKSDVLDDKKDECEQLKTDLEQMKQRTERLLSKKDEVQMLKRENDEGRNRFKGLQEQHSQLKTDLKSAQRKLEVAEKSRGDLQKQLSRLEQSIETEKQRNKELSEQISQTNKEIKNLNKKFESLKRQHRELQSDKDRLEQELEDQIENHQELSSHTSKEIHQLKKFTCEVEVERDEYKDKVTEMDEKHHQLEAYAEELKQMTNRLKSEKAEAVRETNEMKADNEQIIAKSKENAVNFSKARTEIKECKDSLSQKESECKQLQKESKALHKNLKQAEKDKVDEIQRLQEDKRNKEEQQLAKIRQLQLENRKLKDSLAEKEQYVKKLIISHTSDASEKEELVEQIEDEKHSLEDDIRMKAKELTAVKAKYASLQEEVKDMNTEQSSLASQNADLQQKVKDLKELHQRGKIEDKEKDDKLKSLANEKDSLTKELQRSRSDTSAATTQHSKAQDDLKQLRKQEKKLTAENDRLRSILQEREEFIVELNRHEKENTEGKRYIESLEIELDQLKHNLTESKAKVKALKAEVKQLKQHQQTLLSEQRQLKNEIQEKQNDMEQQTRRHGDDVQKKDKDIQQLKNEKKRLQEALHELHNLQAKSPKLEEDLKELSSECSSLQLLVQDREAELKSLTSRNEKMEGRFSEAKSKLKASEDQVKSLESERENLLCVIKQKDASIEDLLKRHSGDTPKKDKIIQQLQNKIAKLEQELENLSSRNKKLEGRLPEAKRKLKESEDQVESLCGKIEQLESDRENLLSVIKQKDASIKDLSQRLSSEMGAKVGADESNLENISIKNRPMNIATDYDLMCSNEWLNAKTELDDKCPALTEDKKANILCEVLTISLAEGTKLKLVLLQTLIAQTFQPGVAVKPDSASPKKATFKEHLVHNLMDFLRETADDADLSRLSKSVEECVCRNHEELRQYIANGEIRCYIQHAALVTWKMVLQRPPMSFVQNGIGESWQGDNKQDVFWSSSNPSDPRSKVKFYVHPALYHGDAMMVKGRVLLSKT